MELTDKKYEYELIDISFELPYEIPEDEAPHCVCEEEPSQTDVTPAIEYDADGIPMGRSRAEIKIREKLIKDFYARWISGNPEKKIWNNDLNGYILVKYVSINETYEKAARSYKSTKAVFELSSILENARLVEEQLPKGNKNQKSFSKMLILRFGDVKLTVGYQKVTDENVQYCISVPQK